MKTIIRRQKEVSVRHFFLKIETLLQKVVSVRQKKCTLRHFSIRKKISKILKRPCDNFAGFLGSSVFYIFFKKKFNKACDIFLTFRFLEQPYNIVGYTHAYLSDVRVHELATRGKNFCSLLFFDFQQCVLMKDLATILSKNLNMSQRLTIRHSGGW